MFDITKFDQYCEDNCLEIKKAKGGLPNSLWETYSAFANCYGGVIILGAIEHKNGGFKTTGLENETKLRKEFWDTINNKQKISANLLSETDVETYDVYGDIVMVIHVPRVKREMKPIYINNDMFTGSFRRNWEGDYHCDKSEVLGMLRDQPETTSDMKLLENMDLDVIDKDTLRGYRNRHMAFRQEHVWENSDDIDYMENIGVIARSERDGKLHPTAAGLLMFGKEYKIVREYPEYFLDYREMLDPTIRWTDRFQSSSCDWSGNVFEFYFRVYNKIARDLKVPFKLEGGDRIDDTPVHKAIREALANCLVNADYYGRCGVVIKKEIDSLVLENPGDVRTGKRQMLRGGISDPRNKAIMKMFNLIGIGERAGSGIPDIFQVWERQGWAEPVVEERYAPDRTVLTLALTKTGNKKPPIKTADKKPPIKIANKKVGKKSEAHFEAILQYMIRDKEYRMKELSELLGLSLRRTREILNNLVDMNKIEKVGSNKDRRYKRIDS